MHKKDVIFVIIFFILAFVRADIVSINSGGSTGITISSGDHIEGFFTGEGEATCLPITCIGLGYNCNSWSDGCGGTVNCGTCVSGYTCQSGTCTATTTPPTEQPPSGPTTPPTTPIVSNITITPTIINLTMLNGTYRQQVITITNVGSDSQTFSVTKTDPDGIIKVDTNSLIISPGESMTLSVTLLAPKVPGIYAGKITIGGKDVSINIISKSQFLLFDSNIVVTNRNYQVSQGGQLKTTVGLVPMGDKTRMDVTLNYVIKDYTGKIYLTQSETVLVDSRINFVRNFGTGNLPLGQYIIGLELVYPGGIAPSSAHFEVLERSAEDTLGLILFILVMGILVIIILIVALLIRMKRGRKIIGFIKR